METAISKQAGEPMRGMSDEKLREVMDSLKQWDEGRLTHLTVSRNQPEFSAMPRAMGDGAQKIFGLPVVVSEFMPEGFGMGRTACRCLWLEVERDGGGLMHTAKRHTVLIKFDA